MPFDLLSRVYGDNRDPVVIAGHQDLLGIHAQLAGAAHPDPDAQDNLLAAAALINQLSQLLAEFPAADPRTVNLVVDAVVRGLRARRPSPSAQPERFPLARAWLDHLRIQKRAATAYGSDDSPPQATGL